MPACVLALHSESGSATSYCFRVFRCYPHLHVHRPFPIIAIHEVICPGSLKVRCFRSKQLLFDFLRIIRISIFLDFFNEIFNTRSFHFIKIQALHKMRCYFLATLGLLSSLAITTPAPSATTESIPDSLNVSISVPDTSTLHFTYRVQISAISKSSMLMSFQLIFLSDRGNH